MAISAVKETAKVLTLETLTAHIVKELEHGRVEISPFVSSYSPHDIEAGSLLERGFRVGIFCGRFVSRLVEFDGHISAIADDTRPVWH